MKIKGVNLGGWLLMEGYILGGRNISEAKLKSGFKKIHGAGALKEFERLFRSNFIKEGDFKNIFLSGANAVRLPFSYRLIEKKPFVYSGEGLAYLDKALFWAKKYRLGVILDLHAAPGAQNCDWHADSPGEAFLWDKRRNQERAFVLWEVIAQRYKDSPSLIGYDLLNEPVLGKRKAEVLRKFYREAIKRIKAVDQKHLIFLEGNNWAQQIDFLKDLIEENISLSIHNYQPLSYTFNFTPFDKFPGKIGRILWDRDRIYRCLERYYNFSLRNKVKIFVGEFGINWRGNFWGELKWLKSTLGAFERFGFGYTYWTYKAVANSVFPDGLYQYLPDSPYIKREGPIYGWENYLRCWKKERRRIVDFWQTNNFTPNKKIIATLKSYFRKQ